MSINKKDFEKDNFIGKGQNIEKVKDFLKTNKDTAYRAKEIAKATKVNLNTTRHSLRILEKRENVIHKDPYWLWKGEWRKPKRSKKK